MVREEKGVREERVRNDVETHAPSFEDDTHTHTHTHTAVSSFDPLPHFIPLLEFRDRIDHWKWIGKPLPFVEQFVDLVYM